MVEVGRVRRFALLAHRWVGLAVAAFLIVAGTTGALLAFYVDLDTALNPELFRARPPAPGAATLDPFELRDRLARQVPPAHAPTSVMLDVRPGETLNYWIDERETFVDPYTGAIQGSRKFGDLTEGRKSLLTFLYRLHYSLSLGEVGTVIFGVVALLWFVDCFVGAYLTFPPRRSARGRGGAEPVQRGWHARWARSWALRTGKLFSLVFTWHRASGLWIWGMLLVFAWSGVALNLGDQVYRPVMKLVFTPGPPDEVPALAQPRVTPRLDARAAREVGRRLVAVEVGRLGGHVLRERWLAYDAKRGVYTYTVESTLDLSERLADTTVTFDGDDGRRRGFHAATGQHAGRTFDSWIIALHFGAIRELGRIYRAVVSVLGVMVTLLSVTGVWIWWRKRKRATPRRDAARSGEATGASRAATSPLP
jgi:uncharacterized iron-regulated membrane protein